MTDQGFPLIEYPEKASPHAWGCAHGESFREAISELAAIRRELIHSKNPALTPHISSLAKKQYLACKKYDEDLSSELDGIIEGSNLTLDDLVILNNYTDFRDLEMPDEGCSSLHIQRGENTFSGQTWDMHESAKSYVSLILVPPHKGHPAGVFFSLVGCLGMMGVNSEALLLGVNNLNTAKARPALMWPLLVRKALQKRDFLSMKQSLLTAPVSSGHNYFVSAPSTGVHLEITPTEKEEVASLDAEGEIFHTNHCLGEKTKLLEYPKAVSSTSHIRYELLKEKLPFVQNFKDMTALLRDHDNYPKSICSHFVSGKQDPAMTCGGAVADLTSKQALFWRGCPKYDHNFEECTFVFDERGFKKSSPNKKGDSCKS